MTSGLHPDNGLIEMSTNRRIPEVPSPVSVKAARTYEESKRIAPQTHCSMRTEYLRNETAQSHGTSCFRNADQVVHERGGHAQTLVVNVGEQICSELRLGGSHRRHPRNETIPNFAKSAHRSHRPHRRTDYVCVTIFSNCIGC